MLLTTPSNQKVPLYIPNQWLRTRAFALHKCMKTFDSILDLSRHFKTEKICRKYLEQIRWGSKPVCPHCNHDKIWRFKDDKIFRCASCRKKFTVIVGTIFENTNIPLTKWFMAIYLILNHKKGISSLQLGRDISITQKSAWFVNHRLRELTRTKKGKPLSGIVEVDETYIGGKQSNKPRRKRIKHPDKTVVFGMLERGKEIRVKVVKDAKAKHLIPEILKNVRPDTYVISDTHNSYKRLGGYYIHLSLNHEYDEYVRGAAHTNTIEGFWSHLKRTVTGIYHYISPKHTQRYCDASAFRYNTRKLNSYERFNLAIANCSGRLTYKDLIRVK